MRKKTPLHRKSSAAQKKNGDEQIHNYLTIFTQLCLDKSML